MYPIIVIEYESKAQKRSDGDVSFGAFSGGAFNGHCTSYNFYERDASKYGFLCIIKLVTFT